MQEEINIYQVESDKGVIATFWYVKPSLTLEFKGLK